MSRFALNAERRIAGKPRATRREGYIPAIVYGRGLAPEPLKVARSEVERLLIQRGGRGLLDLKLDGKTQTVMIKEIQRDPARDEILHIDFYRVSMAEKVQAVVPLTTVGEDEVARRGGILQHQLHEVEIECLPANIPDSIAVDVSNLEPGDVVTVGDLRAPEGVEILTDPEQVVVAVIAPRAVREQGTPADEAADAAEDRGGGEETA